MIGWYIASGVIYTGIGLGLGTFTGLKAVELVVFMLLWPIVVVGSLVKVGIDRAMKT